MTSSELVPQAKTITNQYFTQDHDDAGWLRFTKCTVPAQYTARDMGCFAGLCNRTATHQPAVHRSGKPKFMDHGAAYATQACKP